MKPLLLLQAAREGSLSGIPTISNFSLNVHPDVLGAELRVLRRQEGQEATLAISPHFPCGSHFPFPPLVLLLYLGGDERGLGQAAGSSKWPRSGLFKSILAKKLSNRETPYEEGEGTKR